MGLAEANVEGLAPFAYDRDCTARNPLVGGYRKLPDFPTPSLNGSRRVIAACLRGQKFGTSRISRQSSLPAYRQAN